MTSNTKYNGRRNKRTAVTLMHISPRIGSVLQILDVNSVHILQLYSQEYHHQGIAVVVAHHYIQEEIQDGDKCWPCQ